MEAATLLERFLLQVISVYCSARLQEKVLEQIYAVADLKPQNTVMKGCL